MNYNIRQVFGIVLIIMASSIFAQGQTLLLDKKGEFKVVNWSVYGMGGSDFTKSEKDANYKKLVAVTDVIRKNPVMSELKGFDCEALLVGSSYDNNKDYGIPCILAFNFCFFYRDNKGKEFRAHIEPPHWDIIINKVRAYDNGTFGGQTSTPSFTLRKGFDKAKWESAGKKLSEIFYAPGLKDNLGPGIDRYSDEMVIIYNPDQVPYWKHVTIREVFELLINFWKEDPNEATVDMMVKMLKDELALYSESELEGYAYLGGRGPAPISGVGNDSTKIPVMRANPEYWNKKLPRSAIQIMGFRCFKDRKIYQREMEEQLENNSGEYHVTRFLETLDIKSLMPVIE